MRPTKATEWMDHLGESILPEDSFTLTTGNNYGLDGFSFDTPLNEGVEDSARLPETRGLSGLPDGLVTSDLESLDFQDVTESDDGIVFDEEVSGSKQASLVDLDWLDPTQEQDPDRLPDNESTLNSLPQLEEAWGVDRRTDGMNLIPNRDLEVAQYHESLKETQKSGLPGVYVQEVREAVLQAVRRSHFAKPLEQIKGALSNTFEHHGLNPRSAVQKIEADYGLVGNVFIRAAAFPGIKNGQWVKEIKRSCRTARYVITDDPMVATKLGMKMVSEVPWAEALEHYRPVLTAAGYRLASGDPRIVLQKAFLRGSSKTRSPEAVKPVVKPVVASKEEAQAALSTVPPSVVLKTAEEKAQEAKQRKALLQIAKWVKAGVLTQDDALRLHDANVSPEVMLRVASDLITATGNRAVYEGMGTQVVAARNQVWASLEQEQAEVEAALQKKVQASLVKAVKAGQLTTKEAQRILSLGKSASETQRLISAAIQMAPQVRKAEFKEAPVQEYKGPVQQATLHQATEGPRLSDEQLKIQKAAKRTGIKASEFHKVLKFARQRLNEGLVGEHLDAALRSRFGSPLLKAAKSFLQEIRTAHEGLAGHLYVDAAAYASPEVEGVKGCEQGAAQHRGSEVKYVLAMARCASCVLGSTGVCAKYNKKLTYKVPVANPEGFRAKVLREASAPSSDMLANLFNPDEFNLHNSAVDDIDLDVSRRAKTLKDFTFGEGPEF